MGWVDGGTRASGGIPGLFCVCTYCIFGFIIFCGFCGFIFLFRRKECPAFLAVVFRYHSAALVPDGCGGINDGDDDGDGDGDA